MGKTEGQFSYVGVTNPRPRVTYESLIPYICYGENKDDGKIQVGNRYIVWTESVINLYPKNINEKFDMVLMNIASKIKYFGNTFTVYSSEEDKKLYTDFFIEEEHGKETFETQFNGMIDILEESGMIKHVRASGDDKNTYTLTTNGWSKVQTLQAENTQSYQAFIAMWFDESMTEAKDAIFKAVTDCGYIPIRIDIKEHNNQIVPEIFYEIKQSSFIVVDLTGQRTGVYYEAGYAEALDKVVILTCKKDSFDNNHFDVKQKNTIVWENADDLHQRLIKRIKASIGIRK